MDLPAFPALPISTERLVLRPFDPADLEPLLVIESDPTAVRYVP